MQDRRADVAALAGVAPTAVQQVDVTAVRQGLHGRVADAVLIVATQNPATYWQVGDRFFLDDPFFGDVVAFDQLAYNQTGGLHRQPPGLGSDGPV